MERRTEGERDSNREGEHERGGEGEGQKGREGGSDGQADRLIDSWAHVDNRLG